jgi:hypothetical protein
MLVCFELFAFSLHKADEFASGSHGSPYSGRGGEGDLYAAEHQDPMLC